MNPPTYYAGQPGQLGGLKKVLRKVLPVAAGAAAVATGNPALAIPAAGAAKSVVGKKKVEPPAPPIEPQPAGIFGNLVPADQNALVIGGVLLGGLLLAKSLFRR